ncbi:MAG TPA: prepilin-type N-terminal cleavage/methylation domain-containing protein [bacterium]|nr:prepilin-type N-terminal cleavage/methylation domain-containing protein [bacterium]
MFRNFFKKAKAFTLVEIMVVVAIIGILSTLIIISLDTTKMTARNTRRLADIKQLQIALKMYYADNGFYPTAITAGASLARNGINYLLRIPQNPFPYNDNNCPSQDYQYKQLEGGQRYSLTFCLGDKTDDLSAGTKTATANGILDCPTGYIAVPGSATFETNDFCVMKYEAKCADVATPTTGKTSPGSPPFVNSYDNSAQACSGTYNPLTGVYTGTYVPVSTVTGTPIGNITQATAKTYCQNIGAHLITNAEWMTIARNVEQVASNWFSGVVGTDYVPYGNIGGVTYVLDGSTSQGSGGSTFNFFRNLNLANGEVIMDFSGNVAEWVDDQCTSGSAIGQYQSGGTLSWDDALLTNYERGVSGPSNAAWTGASSGIGGYVGCTTGRVFLRGGAANEGGNTAGIYGLNLSQGSNVTNPFWGFRCVK